MKIACSALFALAALAALPAHAAKAPKKLAGLEQIQTVVVLYGENRSFDNLYGLFPGANGIAQATAENGLLQRDRDGSALATLPPVWQKDGKPDPLYPIALPNAPVPHRRGAGQPAAQHGQTRDLTHRFYQNQMQINGGKNDMFAAYTDAGALTMGHYDGASLPLWRIAREYTLADNFFMAAFGGSYMNHMWLACACTPQFPDAPEKMHAQLDADGKLMVKAGLAGQGGRRRAALPRRRRSRRTATPSTPCSRATSRAALRRPRAATRQLADPAENPLPPQTLKTIGDTLSDKKVTWKWYAGGWNAALKDRKQIYDGDVNFQPHHQPFNYFLRFAPGTKDRALHLKDDEPTCWPTSRPASCRRSVSTSRPASSTSTRATPT